MQLPPPAHRELLAVRSTRVDSFAQMEQMELVIHDAKRPWGTEGKIRLYYLLVQTDDTQDCIINTDASAKWIGAVLMQKDKDGRINIVSTASRIPTPAEQG